MPDTGGRPVALVSGGSRGIGRAVVKRLAYDGYNLAFCYNSQSEAADSCATEIRCLGAVAASTQVDVSDSVAIDSWVCETEEKLGPISVVVTSAGIARDGTLLRMSGSDWHSVVNTNMHGVFNVCRSVVPHLVERRAGSIVNISSLAGIHGNIGQSNYSAAKAGVIGMTKALAREVGMFGIRANVVAPGFIDTDMTSGLSGRVLQRTVDRIPMRRLGTVDEIADAVAFLASDRASYVNACVLRIDGGISP